MGHVEISLARDSFRDALTHVVSRERSLPEIANFGRELSLVGALRNKAGVRERQAQSASSAHVRLGRKFQIVLAFVIVWVRLIHRSGLRACMSSQVWWLKLEPGSGQLEMCEESTQY